MGKEKCPKGHELSPESAKICPEGRKELREEWVSQTTTRIPTTKKPPLVHGQFDDAEEDGRKSGHSAKIFSKPRTTTNHTLVQGQFNDTEEEGPKPGGCSPEVLSKLRTEHPSKFGVRQYPMDHVFDCIYSNYKTCIQALAAQVLDHGFVMLPIFDGGNQSDKELAADGLLRCENGHLYHVAWGSCGLCPLLDRYYVVPEFENQNEVEPLEVDAAKSPEVETTPGLPTATGSRKSKKARRKQRKEREAAELLQQQLFNKDNRNDKPEPEQPISNPNKLINYKGSAAEINDEKEMAETRMDDRNL